MPSIALVVLDTLRKDHFDAHFDWLPGTRYERAYATSHYTVPSHASLFTGRYPGETGTHAKSHEFDPPWPPLAERLSAAGLETHAFSTNVQVSRQFGWDRGFDRFEGSWNCKHANATADIFEWNAFIREHREEGPGRYGKALWACLTGDCDTLPSLRHGLELKYRTHIVEDSGAREALAYVEGTDFADDAFLFVNLMEAHAPWDPPAEYATVDLDDYPGFVETVRGDDVDAAAVRRAYEDSVRYLSDVYREMFAELRGQFDYVVTLADHGEMLGEEGIWGHGFGLYPELTHVPLSVWGLDGPDRVEDVVSLVDVHRTVLELAGADVHEGNRGRDLRGDPTDGAALTEYLGLNWFRRRALADADYADPDRFEEECYGVALPADYYGFETFEGFVESGEATVADPRARLDDLVGGLEYRDGAGDLEVSESVMRDLADLGYV